jgi:hypothetical protein
MAACIHPMGGAVWEWIIAPFDIQLVEFRLISGEHACLAPDDACGYLSGRTI